MIPLVKGTGSPRNLFSDLFSDISTWPAWQAFPWWRFLCEEFPLFGCAKLGASKSAETLRELLLRRLI